mgnify:CR=1 FL=1
MASERSAMGGAGRLTLTVEEAAHLLGISRGLAYELARCGKLPVVRLGRRLLVPKAALNKMLQEVNERDEKFKE